MKQMIKPTNVSFNISSFLIGFLLALCLMLILGMTDIADTQKDPVGLYQACPAGELSVFVIDTQTGQTWRLGRTETYDYGTPYQRKSVRTSIMPTVK